MKLLLFIFLAPIVMFGQSHTSDDLELEIKNRSYNFGSVQQDTLISKNFSIKNVSQKEITLNISSTSCSCTKAELTKTILKPDEVAQLIMELDTDGKYGKTKVYAIIDSNTEQKFYRFLIYGNVIEN